MEFNVMDYGAAGDGKTKDTAAIQQAIDACHQAGGGRVVLPGSSIYLTGSLCLKSNVDLHIESGAVLKASEDFEDYIPSSPESGPVLQPASQVPSYVNCEYHGRPRHYFLYALHGENIRITGEGTIDGSENIYYGEVDSYHIEGKFYPRIPMIFVEDIRHFTVKEVTLTKCAFWTIHPVGCYDVLIDRVRILNNTKMANCDGIDPDHCDQVRIIGCHIECGDDCIVLKTSQDFQEYGPCQNVVISACTLISTSSAIKIGTDSESDFRNISVQNCCISRTNRALSIQLRDKGNVENLIVSNVNIETRRFSPQWWGGAEPIYVTVVDRKEGVTAGRVKNVCFENINCIGENGIFLSGSENHIMEDIRLRNIRVVLKKTSKWPSDTYDIRPCGFDGLISSKIYGIYLDKIKGIRLEDVQIEIDESMELYAGGESKILDVEGMKVLP